MNRELLAPYCAAFSHTTPLGLACLGDQLIDAHRRAPGGLTLEIGTDSGGSTLLMLQILDSIYDLAPMVFSIDPYGSKIYPGSVFDDQGQRSYSPTGCLADGAPAHLYGFANFIRAKSLLAAWANHALFLMRGTDFLEHLIGVPYWQNRFECKIDNFTFVFLDGEHLAATVKREVELIWPHLRSGGSILIDNIDDDPDCLPALAEFPIVITQDSAMLPADQKQGLIIKP